MPPKILHLITTMERDGAQVALLDTLRAINPAAGRFTIAYLTGAGAALADPRPAGVAIVDLSRGGRFDPLVLPRVIGLIRRERFDLIHTHLVHAGIVGKIAARICDLPFVTTRHYASEAKEGTLLYRIEDRLTAGSAAIVAVSAAVRRHLIDRGIAPAERIVVIPNGVDLERFDPLRVAPAVPRSPDRPVLGVLGRLHPQKGQAILLHAFAELLPRFPSAELEIIGEGPLREALAAQALDFGISERVRFSGSVPHNEIPSRLARWDITVMPSLWEGFGIAAAEAMAMERAVVASRIEGLAELIVDGVTGRLVPPNDSDSLARAIAELLLDPDLRLRMGRAARARIEARFSIAASAAALQRLYGGILASPDSKL